MSLGIFPSLLFTLLLQFAHHRCPSRVLHLLLVTTGERRQTGTDDTHAHACTARRTHDGRTRRTNYTHTQEAQKHTRTMSWKSLFVSLSLSLVSLSFSRLLANLKPDWSLVCLTLIGLFLFVIFQSELFVAILTLFSLLSSSHRKNTDESKSWAERRQQGDTSAHNSTVI